MDSWRGQHAIELGLSFNIQPRGRGSRTPRKKPGTVADTSTGFKSSPTSAGWRSFSGAMLISLLPTLSASPDRSRRCRCRGPRR